jgi:hypothetical protein
MPTAPTCPTHIGKPMLRIGKILSRNFKGPKTVLGYRYRCAIPGCPYVATVETRIGKPAPDFAKDHHYRKTITRSKFPHW